jgi:hypothetical protein
MKRIITVGLLVVMSLAFFGCGWNKVCLEERKSTSFNVGEEKTTVVGAEMVQTTFSITQCVSTRYEPTGLNLTLFKREPMVIRDEPIQESVERELLYAGRQGNILHITYREYTLRGMARTPFFQNLYYDLNTSDTIVFQNWIIKVLDANNQHIRFKVVNE